MAPTICLAALLAAALAAGCGREPERRAMPLPVQVLADTSRAIPLPRGLPVPEPAARANAPTREEPPAARVWLERVVPAPPAGEPPPLPAGEEDSLVASPAAPRLEIESGLEPPLLRRAATLVVPAAGRRGGGVRVVELDLLVDESGEVSEVEWAGGSADTTLVAAAERCARGMSFYPALRGGHPVAVWCRQRFDFGAR